MNNTCFTMVTQKDYDNNKPCNLLASSTAVNIFILLLLA